MTYKTGKLDDVAAALVLAGLTFAWLGRAGEAFGLSTTRLSYAEFPLVTLAIAVVLLGSGKHARPPWLFIGLVWFGLVSLISALAHDLPLLQAAMGAMLYLEPFLAMYVVMNVSTGWLRHAAVGVIAGILVVQVPFIIAQWIVFGSGDPVQGTLVDAGAGAHVLGSGLLVGVALMLASPRRFHPGMLALVAMAVGGMVVADAKQVWALIPVVVAVMFVKGSPNRRSTRHHAPPGRRIVIGALLLALLAAPVVVLVANTYVGRVVELTLENGGGKVAVTETLVQDVTSSVTSTAVGLGPGETVSRLAWMRSPEGGIETSPLRSLGVGPSEQALRYHEAATSQGYVGLSSVSYPLSSLLGVFGDYGTLGAVAYAVLLGGILVSLGKSADRLASVALGVWSTLLPLGLISDWLEQTPVTLMLGVISGLALKRSQGERQQPLQAQLSSDVPHSARGIRP